MDPWLTKHRRFCPICKRKVFAKGERKITNQRRLRSSETESDDDDTAPLLSRNDAGNHGTFEEANANPSVVNMDEGISSDDESVLLDDHTRMQSPQRQNPFDRAPSTTNVHRFWSAIVGVFRRNPTISGNTTNIEHASAASSPSSSQRYISAESISNANSITSNNVLNTNLSGSFKDDDDLGPPRSIYEPIGDSNFIDPPSNGGIGVVALPNT